MILTPEVATALLDKHDASHGPQVVRSFRGETVVGEVDEATVVRWMAVILGEQHNGWTLRRRFLALVPKSLRVGA